MEYLDILTSNGESTSEQRPRAEAHAKGLWHRAVQVWIMNSNHQLLLQKRAAIKESHPNMWDVSVAGHLSAGDIPREGARRELKEELQQNVEDTELKFLFTVRQESTQKNGTYINKEFLDVFLLNRDLNLSDIVLQEEEVAEVKWVTPQELKDMVNRADPMLVPHPEVYEKLFEYLQ